MAILGEVCRRYRLRVIHMQPLARSVLVETNRGTKELRAWPRLDILRWSHAWREQMAKSGHRNVERFIRTRDGKPYVVLGRTGYTLTDYARNAKPAPFNRDTAYEIGRLVGTMHLAQESCPFPQVQDVFHREQDHIREQIRLTREWENQEWENGDVPNEAWLRTQLPLVRERMEKAAAFLTTRVREDGLSASHDTLRPENVSDTGRGIRLGGLFPRHVSVQQRDTAHYLRHQYLQHADPVCVHQFLDGYEEVKPLKTDDYVLLLAYLMYPLEAWKQIRICLQDKDGQESRRELVRNSLRRQLLAEELIRHVADRAERGGPR
jgi:Ser/Thr protein kinase RdoA (MazF antagonist)